MIKWVSIEFLLNLLETNKNHFLTMLIHVNGSQLSSSLPYWRMAKLGGATAKPIWPNPDDADLCTCTWLQNDWKILFIWMSIIWIFVFQLEFYLPQKRQLYDCCDLLSWSQLFSCTKRKPPCIGGMELVSLSCNRVFISAESVGRDWCIIAIATKWYQFHTTDKCGFLFMPWITDQLYICVCI